MPGLSTENPGAPCPRSHGSVVDASFSLCASDSEGSALTNGGLSLHSPMKRKLEAEKDYVFDKRLRYSVRQNESNCRFRDIVVRKEEGFTHILLSSQTSDNNALTPEVRAAAGDAIPSLWGQVGLARGWALRDMAKGWPLTKLALLGALSTLREAPEVEWGGWCCDLEPVVTRLVPVMCRDCGSFVGLWA